MLVASPLGPVRALLRHVGGGGDVSLHDGEDLVNVAAELNWRTPAEAFDTVLSI
ncbi:hypothetical protein JOF56_009548 [Kibdelosporangium banguiense]|uniref:Uncharacterized protein n=1 Tax=Kibdelosporangium banguiense TaxID=1365924 RepID=A0ABS4TXN1_9PSEU|nr:hypothetical protein [Kibdelosporangium banguiense]